jgi:hypothetical protein
MYSYHENADATLAHNEPTTADDIIAKLAELAEMIEAREG